MNNELTQSGYFPFDPNHLAADYCPDIDLSDTEDTEEFDPPGFESYIPTGSVTLEKEQNLPSFISVNRVQKGRIQDPNFPAQYSFN